MKAIKLLSSAKTSGSDAIPADIDKAGSPPVEERLSYFTLCKKNAIPQKFTDATIIHLFKRKGNPRMWQSSRHPVIVSCWEDPCKSQIIEWTPWTIRASTRKPVWIQKRQRNNRHDIHRKTASREMPGTECGPVHDLCRPHQSVWQSVVRDFERELQRFARNVLPNS